MPTRAILIPDIESLPQRLIPSLKALLDAAKLGFNAINCGESLALHTSQDVVTRRQRARRAVRRISVAELAGENA